jgi:hypothetical protein
MTTPDTPHLNTATELAMQIALFIEQRQHTTVVLRHYRIIHDSTSDLHREKPYAEINIRLDDEIGVNLTIFMTTLRIVYSLTQKKLQISDRLTHIIPGSPKFVSTSHGHTDLTQEQAVKLIEQAIILESI